MTIKQLAEMFQFIRSLAWSVTTVTAAGAAVLIGFNSHARMERDWEALELEKRHSRFNSHARMERDDFD